MDDVNTAPVALDLDWGLTWYEAEWFGLQDLLEKED